MLKCILHIPIRIFSDGGCAFIGILTSPLKEAGNKEPNKKSISGIIDRSHQSFISNTNGLQFEIRFIILFFNNYVFSANVRLRELCIHCYQNRLGTLSNKVTGVRSCSGMQNRSW